MRLRKGDQVEVYSQEEVSSGSWSCAEIVSGNGRTYSVRYFQTEEAVEKVPRWAIRPCPPPVEGPNVWAAGDLAEAFHNSSWKQARIMQIIGVNCYLARLLGSPLDVLVSQSYLRLRQAWRDGQWFLLGKVNFLTTIFLQPFSLLYFIYKCFFFFCFCFIDLLCFVCMHCVTSFFRMHNEKSRHAAV